MQPLIQYLCSPYKTSINAPITTPRVVKVIGSKATSWRATPLLPAEVPPSLLMPFVILEPDCRVLVDVESAVVVAHSDVTKPSSSIEVNEQEPITSAPAVGVIGRKLLAAEGVVYVLEQDEK